ncbi:hypothetical protein Trydic_g2556 [Trypoxylus dichotomus]
MCPVPAEYCGEGIRQTFQCSSAAVSGTRFGQWRHTRSQHASANGTGTEKGSAETARENGDLRGRARPEEQESGPARRVHVTKRIAPGARWRRRDLAERGRAGPPKQHQEGAAKGIEELQAVRGPEKVR